MSSYAFQTGVSSSYIPEADGDMSGDLQLNLCLIYFNDIIVFSKMQKDHLVQLRSVFKKLKEAGLKLKTSKCDFCKKSLI